MSLYPLGLQNNLYPLGLNPGAAAVLLLRYCLLEFAAIAAPRFNLELLAVPLMAWAMARSPLVAFTPEKICEH